ncbi:homeodomain superfamily [Elasticomyces elasticus]|uniref:Homeodomain superfamily n=1 Tax=Elasticomyces elasticus TaxID=574655 RepID=A0AAN7W596_9PEZI|nr:homeodomain superfamily [Elasticomyces elasticus]
MDSYSWRLNGNQQQARMPYESDRSRDNHRLPTPEASRASDEASDMDLDTHELHSKARASQGTFDSATRYSTAARDSHIQLASYHRNAQHQPAPHSPPYRDCDAQKPSLPPLKTVLGDNLSSPPPTPTIFGASFQPGPREPAYTAATYKPLSLYPHKKARTGPYPESASTYSDASRCSSPGPLRISHGPSAYDGRPDERRMVPDTGSYANAQASRRLSVQHAFDIDANARAPQGPSHNASGPLGHSERTYAGNGQHYRTPDQTPTATALNQEFPAMGSYTSSHDTDYRTRRGSGYSTVEGLMRGYPSEPSREQHHQHMTYPPVGRSRTMQMDSHRPYQEQDCGQRPGHLPPPSYHRSPYGSTDPSYFMPSQYDHQQGKARKRSNLPKQSTEIMKTWFDRNITNPYPSEDQKALFSRATGISMTQVSNWFINHRRRCPELRDRRERHRSHGAGSDMQ